MMICLKNFIEAIYTSVKEVCSSNNLGKWSPPFEIDSFQTKYPLFLNRSNVFEELLAYVAVNGQCFISGYFHMLELEASSGLGLLLVYWNNHLKTT